MSESLRARLNRIRDEARKQGRIEAEPEPEPCPDCGLPVHQVQVIDERDPDTSGIPNTFHKACETCKDARAQHSARIGKPTTIRIVEAPTRAEVERQRRSQREGR